MAARLRPRSAHFAGGLRLKLQSRCQRTADIRSRASTGPQNRQAQAILHDRATDQLPGRNPLQPLLRHRQGRSDTGLCTIPADAMDARSQRARRSYRQVRTRCLAKAALWSTPNLPEGAQGDACSAPTMPSPITQSFGLSSDAVLDQQHERARDQRSGANQPPGRTLAVARLRCLGVGLNRIV